MAGKERIIRKVIAEIDWFLIERVRELRKSKFSQTALSIEIGFAEGFISRIENPNHSATYSSRHINLLAKVLKVKISDIFPPYPLSNDLILLVIKIKPATKLKIGEKNYDVIDKIPLTEDEIKDFNNKKLNRVKKAVLPKQKEKPKSKKRKL